MELAKIHGFAAATTQLSQNWPKMLEPVPAENRVVPLGTFTLRSPPERAGGRHTTWLKCARRHCHHRWLATCHCAAENDKAAEGAPLAPATQVHVSSGTEEMLAPASPACHAESISVEDQVMVAQHI